ncbi:hypothetical protein MANES_16G093425v8 [Manihot esculenta]|uniref:Uncharacterized protein n=1 Tax=Manihot esculenta TaxID=3983 RepID=A0ACB7G6X4_MANES|nr:hypothetical protein MANES_16G093425v8 [Manihot esculenta]
MIVTTWNCRGSISSKFSQAFFQYKKLYKSDIFYLLETKVSGDNTNQICRKLGYDNWIRVEAVGYNGGIWIMWTKNFFRLQLSTDWFTENVMALWEDLNVSSNERRWLIVGDFNSLLTAEEQCGYNSFNAAGSRDFQNSLSTSELVDLGYEGTTFTWCRGRGYNNLKMARLDRALCSTNWRMAFSEAKVIRPVRLHSDHIPVIIDMRPHKSTPKLGFRFQLAWIPHKGFSDEVKHNWQKGVSIIEAAKGIGGSLSEWNRNVFGNIFAEKKRLLKRLKGVHRLSCEKVLELDRSFTAEDIFKALSNMAPNKASGPDGFQAVFLSEDVGYSGAGCI